jgi:uncharacterized protein YdaU (DUF1376 family)
MNEPKLLAEWFWTDRWMGSSAFLLPIEPRGLYREMLSQAWRRGARLPADHEAIRRAVGCTLVEWNRCWPKIAGYWRVEDDALVNDTQVAVWLEAKAIQERASSRGRAGAQARAQALAQAQREHVLKSQPPSPSPSPKERKEHAPTNVRAFRPTDTTDEIAERAGRFCERYALLYEKHRKGARYLGKPNLDYLEAVTLCQTWPDERLDQIATVFLNTDHEFAEKGSRTMAQFRAMASWCDSKLVEAGIA